MLKLDGVPPEIEFSLHIYFDHCVVAYKYKKKIQVRDLVNGFSNRLDKFSQIDEIIAPLRDAIKDNLNELKCMGKDILKLPKNGTN